MKVPLAELLWLESKQKLRDRNYESIFPELTYEMAKYIRVIGIEKLREELEKENKNV